VRSGNILWENDRISAIVDWEEAGYGDPGMDVAYCLMELYLEGMDTAAAEFLQAYEQEAGRPVANLAYWELAAAARPMIDIDGWITRPFMAERFRRFIANALKRAGN
jgi:aminoglycoside phosphotransferase (APT) family kinase protein